MLTSHSTLEVAESSQIGEARRTAVRLSQSLPFSETQRGAVAIVATELATNLVRYGKNGRLLLQSGLRRAEAYLELMAVDAGPGIEDVQRSLQDGFSSGGTAGTGLGAVRRLSDVFDIYSVRGAGTVVFSGLGAAASRGAARGFSWGSVSTPAPREMVCGDSWRVVEKDSELSVMIADGLGHGPLASEAAERAAGIFAEAPFEAPSLFCDRAHRALSGTRGAAVAMARIEASGGVRYAGVGNIAGFLVTNGKSRGLSSQNGTIGVTVRRVQQFDYDLPPGGLLVMHSDGLTARWSFDDYPGLTSREPALIAGVLHRDCLRGRDDATVVVVRN